jgi:hypothetical protein
MKEISRDASGGAVVRYRGTHCHPLPILKGKYVSPNERQSLDDIYDAMMKDSELAGDL